MKSQLSFLKNLLLQVRQDKRDFDFYVNKLGAGTNEYYMLYSNNAINLMGNRNL